MLGGASFGDAWEQVVRDIGDLEPIEVKLPTVAKTTKGQWKFMDFRVSLSMCVCVCVLSLIHI